MENKYIKELFAIPIGLELEASVEGQKFYSSNGIKKSFMKAIGSTDRSKDIYPQIESLVMKKKLLVPCYLSKNMYGFFKHKLWGRPEDKDILGFYHMKQKRVFILIDNNVNYIGTAKNDIIASTTMHECVHLYADRMKGKFLSTFKSELERFYNSYLCRVFELKKKPNIIKIVNFISKFEYNRVTNMNKQLITYYYLLEKELKPYTKLNDSEFTKLLTRYIVQIKLSLTQFSTFLREYKNNRDIFTPLYKAYKEAFGKRNTVSGVFQELASVSEVICILSEIRPTYPKIKKMFKDMA